jgi:acetolactate synthase-1/2/3 large subunit
VVLALPEDMLLDQVEAVDRPRINPVKQAPWPNSWGDMFTHHLFKAKAPVMIVGGAGWTPQVADWLPAFPETFDIPVAAAFRRQDAFPNTSPIWAGNLGYGPNPKLVSRIKSADLLIVVGARLGEATTDGYSLITPEHEGQTLVHVHPDPCELNSVYKADMAICADLVSFASAVGTFALDYVDVKSNVVPKFAGAQAHADYLEWSTPAPRDGVKLDLGMCVAAMHEKLPADSIICNGAGNFSGWWHRYWRYAGPGTQLAPTAGAMGYGVPAATAAALRRPGRMVVALAGDGDFLMNGQELATAIAHGANMLVLVIDNGAYGTIRMHQEREFPGRVSGTRLRNPDFAVLGRAYGCWAETVETTEQFAPALDRAMAETGVRLLHLKTDVEIITPGATLSAIRGD